MAIEDYVSKFDVRPTKHPPSRVKAMLVDLRGKLQVPTALQRGYNFVGLRLIAGPQLLPEIDEALAEWTRLDDLVAQELAQRQRIAARLSAFVSFSVGIREQLRGAERKRRRPLTAEQKVVAAAKLRATRKARGTMGKRQKKRIKGH
jgi:hypothetical protein